MTLLIIAVICALSCATTYVIQNSDLLDKGMVATQLAVSHLQLLALFPYMNYPWPSYFNGIVQWIDAIFDFRIMDTTFGDCLLADASLTYTAKFVFQVVLLPTSVVVVAALAMGMLWLKPTFLRRSAADVRSLKVRPSLGQRVTSTRALVVATSVTVFVLYQGLTMYSLGMLSCRQVDYGGGNVRSLLVEDMAVDCVTSKGARSAAWPVAIFQLIGVPAAFVGVYSAHFFARPGYRNERFQFGAFLLAGLTQSTWYWPVVLLVRRGLLTVIVIYLDDPQEGFLMTWVLTLYLIAVAYLRPYFSKSHTFAEIVGVSATLVSVNLASLYRLNDAAGFAPAIAPIVILLESIATFGYVATISRRVRNRLLEWMRLREPAPEQENSGKYHDPEKVSAWRQRYLMQKRSKRQQALEGDDDDASQDDDEPGRVAAEAGIMFFEESSDHGGSDLDRRVPPSRLDRQDGGRRNNRTGGGRATARRTGKGDDDDDDSDADDEVRRGHRQLIGCDDGDQERLLAELGGAIDNDDDKVPSKAAAVTVKRELRQPSTGPARSAVGGSVRRAAEARALPSASPKVPESTAAARARLLSLSVMGPQPPISSAAAPVVPGVQVLQGGHVHIGPDTGVSIAHGNAFSGSNNNALPRGGGRGEGAPQHRGGGHTAVADPFATGAAFSLHARPMRRLDEPIDADFGDV